ncbi:WAT1-related protein At4g30420-like [Andrographis paniculata]|uniref:WAT1-related protein At4g30420-like n=1 Tax=Andrographis paniculata TaxID=175694 RepID=UPI0021E8B4D3|nr:WAT1-related protein At4g30420-like [Andrographis paniculata]
MGFFEQQIPTTAMIGCQILYSAVALSGRAVLLDGLSSKVFVVYRQCFAFFLIAPLAFFSRREKKECGLGWRSLGMISLLSFIGVTVNQNMYYSGLYLATSSAASSITNLVPALTFILAYTFGLEKVNWRSVRSGAKVVGTVLCVGGAAAMALLKGPKLLNTTNNFLLLLSGPEDTWLLGCSFLFGSAFCWSLWLILQAHVSGWYPDHLALTAWMCLIAAVQSAIWTVLVEPDLSVWKLTSPFQLFSCFFAGLTSAVTFFGQAWCTSRRGPLFAALFNPLCTVIVTIIASIFMHEELYSGGLMGGLVVILGLYIVLWGKAKENTATDGEEDDIAQLKSDETDILEYAVTIDLEEPFLSEKISEKFEE